MRILTRYNGTQSRKIPRRYHAQLKQSNMRVRKHLREMAQLEADERNKGIVLTLDKAIIDYRMAQARFQSILEV